LEGLSLNNNLKDFLQFVVNAFRQYVNEVVSDTLKGALEGAKKAETGPTNNE